MVATFFFDSPELRLRHHSTVIAEVIVVAVLRWNADFWEVPVLRNSLPNLLSMIALFKELIGKFVLCIDPALDVGILRIFHVSIRIRNFHFCSISGDVFREFITTWRFA